MSSTSALDDAMRAIAGIYSETLAGIDLLTTDKAGHAGPLTPMERAGLVARLDGYAANLKAVAEAAPAGLEAQMKLAKKLLLYSFDARLCAVVRTFARKKAKAR